MTVPLPHPLPIPSIDRSLTVPLPHPLPTPPIDLLPEIKAAMRARGLDPGAYGKLMVEYKPRYVTAEGKLD